MVVELNANSSKMVGELQKANSHIEGLGTTAKKAGDVMKVAFAAVTTGVFGKMIKESIDATDKIGKLSQRLGASTEALSELQYVAELSGVSFNNLTMGLQRMTRRVSEAASGTGEARGALEELGLSSSRLTALRPEQQFEIIADSLSKLENSADRVRLAMKFFDSEGVALVQTMGEGAEGIREMREEARKLGLSLSTKDTMAAAQFNDQLTKTQGRLNALAREIATNSVEAFNTLTEVFSQTGDQAAAATPDLSGIQAVIKGAGAAAFVTWNVVEALTRGIVALGMAVAQLKEGGISGAIHELKIGFELMKFEINQAVEGVEKLFNYEPPVAGTGDGGSSLLGMVAANDVTAVDENPLKRVLGADPDLTLEKLQEHLLTEDELLQNSFINRQAILESALSNNLITEDRFNSLSMKLRVKHYRDLDKLDRKKSKTEKTNEKNTFSQRLQNTSQFFGQYGALSDAFLRASTIASSAQALIATFTGQAEALKLPFPANLIAAAKVGLAGFGFVSSIKSVTGGGGGVSAPSSSGLPSATVDAIGDDGGLIGQAVNDEEVITKSVTINVEGLEEGALVSKDTIRAIVDQINEEENANVRIVL